MDLVYKLHIGPQAVSDPRPTVLHERVAQKRKFSIDEKGRVPKVEPSSMCLDRPTLLI